MLKHLVEAITGEFKPRTPEQSFAVACDDDSWILDGHIPIVDLKDVLDLRETPNEDKGQYHTLSGMLMLMISFEEQLTQDVIELMTVFCAKLYGKRSHHNKRKVIV